MLKCNSEEFARAAYDFDHFFKKAVGVTSCGEIRASALALKEVFGRKSVQLLTDDGHLLDLSFSEKVLLPSSENAHVNVTGELPPAQKN
ncbi:MAG: hypothetical protein ABSD11_06535 [Methylocella sp.]